MGYKKQNSPVTPTTDVYLRDIADRVGCGWHKKSPGKPCWWIHQDTGDLVVGICNNRATKAGFVGKISPQSLNRVNGAPRFAKKK